MTHKIYCNAWAGKACTCGSVRVGPVGEAIGMDALGICEHSGAKLDPSPLEAVSDEMLRAERERRGLRELILAEPLERALRTANRTMAAERDEWKRKYAELVGESRHVPAGRTLSQHLDITHRDRDEWKRRAEAAEATECCMKCGAKFDTVELVCEHVRKFHTLQPDSERGPGIADRNLKPDNSVAWLDEDLLCEDA